MSVNGVTNNVPNAQNTYQSQASGNSTAAASANESTAADEAAVYEPSTAAKNKKYVPDKELIAKLKADSNQRQADLMNLVRDMLSKQANKYGQANDIWKLLSSGNFEVDAVIQLKDERWAAIEVTMGAGELEKAAENLLKFRDNIDYSKMPQPSFLMVLTATQYAFQMKNGVWVVPISCLRD